MPHFNFFPQLNDDEENFLNECTVSIFNNGNGIDKWNIFCTSNQVLTLYLTLYSPFPDLDIRTRLDDSLNLLCVNYSDSTDSHISIGKSFISYIKSRSLLFSKLFNNRDLDSFIEKINIINQNFLKGEAFLFRSCTNFLTKLIFGSFNSKNIDNENSEITENLNNIFIDLKHAEWFLPSNAWNVDSTLALSLLKQNQQCTKRIFRSIISFIFLYSKKIPIPDVILPRKQYNPEGYEFLQKVPDIQKNLINKYNITTDQWFYMNSIVQICSNYNTFGFRENLGGISSPHLQGTVTPIMKNFLLPRNMIIDEKKFPFKKEILLFLK